MSWFQNTVDNSIHIQCGRQSIEMTFFQYERTNNEAPLVCQLLIPQCVHVAYEGLLHVVYLISLCFKSILFCIYYFYFCFASLVMFLLCTGLAFMRRWLAFTWRWRSSTNYLYRFLLLFFLGLVIYMQLEVELHQTLFEWSG